ncbi:ABC transporter substrate-binding protein [Petroclostridium sp. X23]|uniref:ABC transporter substrate-binding protein n=1 Tax=Petroclostridium sp. X23 TaxID=3045146 RepID=UPI0024AD2182|nr:ABC transporter substrate-binding protein [Petroclostridium sp. X23]WHH57779.1 ABC transporter substrate-binding protein [Petroclostridium sp. X23]
MGRHRFEVSRNVCIFIIIFLLVGIAGFFFIERKRNDSIIIGFSAQLTGRQAELGVQERNGVQLAVEKINADGGIAGRKISLIIHDDLGIPEEAQSGDHELIKKGAVAIIGHATTAQTLAGLKVTDSQQVVMISPTVSTSELSGLDDYFFRVYPSFEKSSENFAKYAYKVNGITRMAVIYDIDNLAYSKTYSKVFAHEFQSLGGEITDQVSFSSADHPDFSPLLSKLQESEAEGLLIVASDIDTAFIAQKARLMGWQIPMFTSAWAQTETLINNGGKAVEGMKLEQSYTLANKSQSFIDFQSRYKARFGKEPSFGAAFSYEATLVLSDALKKTNGNKAGLKQALLETHHFNGIMDDFSFDRFGDVERPWYLSTVRNGKFVIVDKLASINFGGIK